MKVRRRGSRWLLVFAVLVGAVTWGGLVPQEAKASTVTEFVAVEDILVSGGVKYDDYFLRTGPNPNTRTVYIKFTVSGLTDPIVSASLRLGTVDAVNTGNPKLRVYGGLSNSWTDSTFSVASPPGKGSLIASHGTSIPYHTTGTIDLGGYITGNGTYTLILQGGDTANDNAVIQSFGSSESSVAAYRPYLLVETEPEEQPGIVCDDIIENDTSWNYDGSNADPGDVICLEAGVRPATLRIDNVHGTADNPITLINYGGAVTIATNPNNPNDNGQYAVKIANSSHFRLTGTGDPAIEHGIRLSANNQWATALQVILFSTNYELDHLEIFNMPNGYAGMTIFTNPTCDPATQRGNFTQRDTRIHHNLVQNTGAEGMYIGHSYYYNGLTATCSGQSVKLWPHSIEGLRVYDNVLRNNGADALQIGSATQDVEAYGNVIENYGTKNELYQQNGVQINSGTTGKFYNNRILGGTGMGIQNQGRDGVRIFNNLIVGAGMDGIISSDLVNPNDPVFGDDPVVILNNTIVNPAGRGVYFWNRQPQDNLIYNNLIVHTGAGTAPGKDYLTIQYPTQTDYAAGNNYFTNSLSTAAFVNAGSGNYRLQSGSPAVNAGNHLSAQGVTFDLEGIARPKGGSFDIGAYESH